MASLTSLLPQNQPNAANRPVVFESRVNNANNNMNQMQNVSFYTSVVFWLLFRTRCGAT